MTLRLSLLLPILTFVSVRAQLDHFPDLFNAYAIWGLPVAHPDELAQQQPQRALQRENFRNIHSDLLPFINRQDQNFLQNANRKVYTKVVKVMKARREDFDRKRQHINNLIQQEKERLKARFMSLQKRINEKKQEIDEEHRSRMAGMSKEAQEADAKIQKVVEDKKIDEKEKKEEVTKIVGALPLTVKNEFKNMMNKRDKNTMVESKSVRLSPDGQYIQI